MKLSLHLVTDVISTFDSHPSSIIPQNQYADWLRPIAQLQSHTPEQRSSSSERGGYYGSRVSLFFFIPMLFYSICKYTRQPIIMTVLLHVLMVSTNSFFSLDSFSSRFQAVVVVVVVVVTVWQAVWFPPHWKVGWSLGSCCSATIRRYVQHASTMHPEAVESWFSFFLCNCNHHLLAGRHRQ